MRFTRAALIPSLIVYCLAFGSLQTATAQWTGAGVQISAGNVDLYCPSCPRPYACAMIPDGADGAILAWSEKRAESYDIYAQRLDGSGIPVWTPFGVPVCTANGDQVLPVITADGAGGAIVAWQDSRGGTSLRIYAQRVIGGVVQWQTDGARLSLASGDQSWPTIATDGAGGAIVAWTDGPSYLGPDIYAQRVTASGAIASGWSASGVALCTATDVQQLPTAVPDGSGGAIVAWEDLRSGTHVDSDVYAQHITGGGLLAPGWAADGNPVSSHHRYQLQQAITTDGAGGAIIAWYDNRAEVHGDILVQRLNGSGAPQWTAEGVALTANSRGQYNPIITADGAGGAVIVWEDATSASEQDIYAQRVNAAGSPQWTSGGVGVCTAPAYQNDPQLAPDGLGGAIVAWIDLRASNSPALVYSQRVDASGAPSWAPNGIRVCTSDAGQGYPSLVPESNGDAIVGWLDFRQGGNALYAGRLQADGVVPVTLSLIAVDATAQQVRLTWYDGTGTVVSASVERRDAAGAWMTIGVIGSDGGGRLAFVDRAIATGARYAYRLAIPAIGGVDYSVEAWVDVPADPTLTLEGVHPNPARGSIRAFFSLPDGRDARLDLVDVSGRLVARWEVGWLGPGRHEADFPAAMGIPPGVYRLRLSREGRSLVTQVTVMR